MNAIQCIADAWCRHCSQWCIVTARCTKTFVRQGMMHGWSSLRVYFTTSVQRGGTTASQWQYNWWTDTVSLLLEKASGSEKISSKCLKKQPANTEKPEKLPQCKTAVRVCVLWRCSITAQTIHPLLSLPITTRSFIPLRSVNDKYVSVVLLFTYKQT